MRASSLLDKRLMGRLTTARAGPFHVNWPNPNTCFSLVLTVFGLRNKNEVSEIIRNESVVNENNSVWLEGMEIKIKK